MQRGDRGQARRGRRNRACSFEVALGLGYVGQSYHVPVSVDAGRASPR